MSVATLNARALISIEEARRYVWRSEDDNSRDEILIDAVNDVSDSIWDHCEREFKSTTIGRSGTDGVTNATTTFTSATAAFTFADVGQLVDIATKGNYRVVSVTNATTVILSGSLSAGTALAWAFREARVFDYDGSGSVDLAPYDLRELDALVLYTDRDAALQVTPVAANYRLWPTGRARGGTYLSLLLPRPAQHEPDYGFGWQVTVTGEWGMATVPGAVRLACKEWVENIVKNPGQYASHTMGGYTVTPEIDVSARRAGMPPSVRHRLDPYQRRIDSPLQVVRFARPDSYPPAIPYALPTL